MRIEELLNKKELKIYYTQEDLNNVDEFLDRRFNEFKHLILTLTDKSEFSLEYGEVEKLLLLCDAILDAVKAINEYGELNEFVLHKFFLRLNENKSSINRLVVELPSELITRKHYYLSRTSIKKINDWRHMFHTPFYYAQLETENKYTKSKGMTINLTQSIKDCLSEFNYERYNRNQVYISKVMIKEEFKVLDLSRSNKYFLGGLTAMKYIGDIMQYKSPFSKEINPEYYQGVMDLSFFELLFKKGLVEKVDIKKVNQNRFFMDMVSKLDRSSYRSLYDEVLNYIKSFILTWPLSFACSIKFHDTVKCKSEYVFSQLILDWISIYNNELYGIKYLSNFNCKNVHKDTSIDTDAKLFDLHSNLILQSKSTTLPFYHKEFGEILNIDNPVSLDEIIAELSLRENVKSDNFDIANYFLKHYKK